MFEYEILRLIWWVLIGVLLVGFAVTDGFDMGVGALVPVIGKNDTERRVMINSIAPHWEGQPSLVGDSGWCSICCMAFSLRNVVFWILSGDDSDVGCFVAKTVRPLLSLKD